MWKQTKTALVHLSLALNAAFSGVWLTHAAASRWQESETRCEPADGSTVWCPLHRQLNVSAEQWSEIEPHLRSFRAAADEICQQIGDLRRAVIDQLAAEQPNRESIQTKQAEILDGQRRMQRLVIEQLMAEKKVLSADQQRQLFELLRGATGSDRGGPLLVPGRGHENGIGQVLRTGGQDGARSVSD